MKLSDHLTTAENGSGRQHSQGHNSKGEQRCPWCLSDLGRLQPTTGQSTVSVLWGGHCLKPPGRTPLWGSAFYSHTDVSNTGQTRSFTAAFSDPSFRGKKEQAELGWISLAQNQMSLFLDVWHPFVISFSLGCHPVSDKILNNTIWLLDWAVDRLRKMVFLIRYKTHSDMLTLKKMSM